MNVQIFADYAEMSRAAAVRIADIVRAKPDALLCLAAGHTSIGVFEAMLEMARRGEADFGRCVFVGLDEWAGLGEDDDGSCRRFMNTRLFEPLGVRPEAIVFYDGRADLEAECRRIDAFLAERGPIDLMLLGMGMNGHLGLNEPGTPYELRSHVVDLDDTTKTVGQKYFRQEQELSRGVTMGMLHVASSRQVLLTVGGAGKAAIVKRLLAAEPGPELPASYLKRLSHASLLLDREAAGEASPAAD